MAVVNVKSIELSIMRNGQVKKTATLLASKKFDNAKMDLLTNIREHPVSREIEAGPNANNLTNTLNGYGNLFSFIGFREGEDPITDLINSVYDSVKMRYRRIVGKSFIFDVTADLKKIEDRNPMPWGTERSWVSAVARGISGLNFYLSRMRGIQSSRSGTAIQTHKKIRKNAIYKRTPYLNEMINQFNKQIVRKR